MQCIVITVQSENSGSFINLENLISKHRACLRVCLNNAMDFTGTPKTVQINFFTECFQPTEKIKFCCFSLNQIKTWPHTKLLYTSSTAVVLYGSKCHSFVEIHADKAKKHFFCSSQTNSFFGYVSNLAPVSSRFSSVSMSSTCSLPV